MRIGPTERGAAEVGFAQEFADVDGLREVRVIWVRTTLLDPATSAAMTVAEEGVRRTIPQERCSPYFADLVFPTRADDLEVPPSPARWQQFVVAPEDRPAPAAADAFYSPDRVIPQTLHATLAIGGILGGQVVDLPELWANDTSTTWVMHPFSRVVDGGSRARREVFDFLATRLPGLSAADIAAREFMADEEPEQLQDRAVEWIQELDDGALRLHLPTLALADPGRRSFWQYCGDLLRTLPWLTRALFVRVGRAEQSPWRRWLERQVESVDLGTHVGDKDPAAVPTATALRITDWLARFEERRAAAVPAIKAAGRDDGRLPAESVWKAVASLPLALVDGSQPPAGWVSDKSHGRVMVLRPVDVFRESHEEVRERADLGAGGLTELPGVRAELGRAGWIDEPEVMASLHDAADGLRREPLAPTGPADTPVSATASKLLEELRQADAVARDIEAKILLNVAGPRVPLPLLPRLRSRVLGDLLRARLLSDRLQPASWPTVPVSVEPVVSMLRRVRRELSITLCVALAGGWLVVRYREEITEFLAASLGQSWSWRQAMAALLVLALAVVGGAAIRMFRVVRSYDERGSRLLELASALEAAEVALLRERNRLRNADRVLARWVDILSRLYPQGPAAPPEDSNVPDDLPNALRVAAPQTTDEELRELTAERAVQKGWCAHALDALVTAAKDPDHRDSLWSDDGLRGGALESLHDEARSGRAIRDHWAEWSSARAKTVSTEMAGNGHEVAEVSGGAGRRVVTALDFVDDVTDDARYTAGRDHHAAHLGEASTARRVLREGGAGTETTLDLTPQLTRAAVLVELRAFRRESAPEGPEAGLDDSDDSDR